MNLSSGTQSIIAGAVFDFAAWLTTRPKTVRAGAEEEASPMVDLLEGWASERGLSLDNAMVQDWNTQPGQVTLASLSGADDEQMRRVAGAVVDFADYLRAAASDDYENTLLRWAAKTGLEIHDPQPRWHSSSWA